MNKITINVEAAPTLKQLSLITEAARMTQERGFIPRDHVSLDEHLMGRLVSLGHTTCLEHASFSVTVIGASRVFLAQITRHRMMSPTSGSQQYQKHNGFDYLELPFHDLPLLLPEQQRDLELRYHDFMEHADVLYTELEAAMGRDWARYVLPGACRNNLLLTANLREWFCSIIPLRACRRNTPETEYVIALILRAMCDNGLESIVKLSGPACLTCGHCDQGHMSCGKPLHDWTEMLEVQP